jgi:BirA family biotin operon repressor/biotin-[acetyl-CoA-carboxylase] ligase
MRGRVPSLVDHLLFLRTVGSTNDVALAAAAESGQPTVVIADAQTGGRGRRGRKWFSPAGSGLYVSIVLDLSEAAELERARGLTPLAAGVALAEAISASCGIDVLLKWPNDLMTGGRKLGGILAEAATPTRIVVGYGLNVRASAFPSELQDRATAIDIASGLPADRARLCVESLAAIWRRYRDLLAGRFDAILDAWRALAPHHVGAPVSWSTSQGPQRGVTAGVDEWGALIVRVGDRTERLMGEVSWL